MANSDIIAVTGATGFVGSRVATRLAEAGARLRLVVRDPTRAPQLAGAEIRQASAYGAHEEMRAALEGADTVFLVPATESADRVEQHRTAVDAAVAAGVRRVVYLSAVGAAPDAIWTLVREHWQTEEHIRSTGVAWTFLRFNLYMDFIPFMASADGVVRGPAGQGRVAAVLRDDVAAAVAAVLASDGHDGRVYELTGTEAFTLAEAAEAMSRLTGRAVRFHDQTDEEAFASQAGQAPDSEIRGWVGSYWAIRDGLLEDVSPHVRQLTGREPVRLADWLGAHPEALGHVKPTWPGASRRHPGRERRWPTHILEAMTRLAHLAALALCAALAGCGGRESSGGATAPAADAGIEHVHGLGVDPADDSLIIATHSGLFRSPDGTQEAARIGDRRQDTMGFTVVGPRRYLGSGHPDLRDELPPLLGLIRSTDGGTRWKPVSLLGEADFHVLRAAGRRVLGINSTDGRLMVSSDAGATWRRESLPAPLIDIAFHPEDTRRLIGSGEDGVYESRNAGESWRRIAGGPAGLLAWPEAKRLLLLDDSGRLQLSSDGGQTFAEAGAPGGPPAAFAADGGDLYVATHDNRILVSRDGGRSWQTRVDA